jgi:DNA-binding transcriptional regulator YhcF (GntR family)
MLRQHRSIAHDADRPVFKQVADDIREQIRLGALQPGEPLPGEKRIADIYGVGENSVRSALRLLRIERLIVTERAVGSRVREPEERSTMMIPLGARVIIRPADDAERRRFGLDEHEPVVVIETADGADVLPAYRVVLVADPESEAEE